MDIWHDFGSVGTPILLVPLFTAFVGRWRMPPMHTVLSMILSGSLSLLWLLSKHFTTTGDYWLELEPIFPGILLSLGFYVAFRRQQR